MIPVTYIQRNINKINTKYSRARNPLDSILYAKLAIIEVGGWIEMSMDDIANRLCKKLQAQSNIDFYRNAVDQTWGFDYDRNFRRLLIQAVGISSVEKLETRLDTAKFSRMKAAIGTLKVARNSAAHTYIKNPGATITLPAPLTVKVHFVAVYEGLKDIEQSLKALKLI